MKHSMVLCVLVATLLLASSAYGKRRKRKPCGRQFSNARIVGGEEAPEGDWPWQAQLRAYGERLPFCGGTLVGKQWVVTAAHCTYGAKASELYVRLGAHELDGLNGTGPEQDIAVEKIFDHKKYNPRTFTHDISMLKLRTPAKLNRDVNLACLPRSRKNVKTGTKCWVTGFGTLESGGDRAKFLMQVEVPIVSHGLCKRKYKVDNYKVDKSMICAGLKQGGKDACQGDSGGPMVCEHKGKYYLEGAVSWGVGCALKGKYGVYADIPYFKKWIAQVMRKN